MPTRKSRAVAGPKAAAAAAAESRRRLNECRFEGADSEMMLAEERLRSFGASSDWPFDAASGSGCTPDKMAAAGFYLASTDAEPDLVRCYYCRRELDGWEPEDDPWAEHARRECAYIKLGKAPEKLTLEDVAALEVTRETALQVGPRKDRTRTFNTPFLLVHFQKKLWDSMTTELDELKAEAREKIADKFGIGAKSGGGGGKAKASKRTKRK